MASKKDGGGDGGGDSDLFSTRNLVIGGIVLGGVIAAIVSLSFRNSRKSSKKSESKKSHKKTTVEKPSTATGGKKPGAVSSKPPASKDNSGGKKASAVSSKPPASEDNSAGQKNDAVKSKETSTTPEEVATVEDIDEPESAKGKLQTEGEVLASVFEQFLQKSNQILQKAEMKEKCAAIYKSGGNVGKYLQEEQGKLWRKFGVDPEYGVQKLAECISTRGLQPAMGRVLQESLMLEEQLFTYAYHGSQEAVDRAAERVKRLVYQSQQEMTETAMKYKDNQAEMQNFMRKLMGDYKKINEELKSQNVADPMVTTELKAKMSDEKMIVLLKGQIIVMQHQRGMMMRQQAPNAGMM